MHRLARTFAPALLVVAAAAFTACGGEDPQQLIASAKTFLAANDAKAAIIQVKSALQADANNAEARFLLGKALLLSGDPAAAGIELRKALDLRHPENEVSPELANALFAEGQYLRITELFGSTNLSDPLAEARLKVTVAQSHGAMGRLDLAQRAMAEALRAVPGYGPAQVFAVRLQADGGDLDGAITSIEAQLARTPEDHEAWQLKGDLLNFGKRDMPGALAAYKQALALKPDLIAAHNATMTLLLGAQDMPAARAQLAQLQKVLPNHPQTAYFAGNVELLAGNIEKADEIAQSLLRVAPENTRIQQLAGAVAFEKRSFLQAESLLAKVLQKAPEQTNSRLLLALTYLQLSEPNKALSMLQPLLDTPNRSHGLYTMAAQAHLQAGDLAAAEAAFAQAAKLKPDDTRSQTALAISKVLGSNPNAGVAELRSLAAADESVTADLPLIGTLVRNKDYPGALKAIQALEKKTPGKPMAANLRGRVLLLQGKRAEARTAFEQSLGIQASFYPATAALAQMAIQDGQPDEAQRLLDGALKTDPRNLQALLSSARLKASRGAPRDQIVAMFESAIQQNSGAAAPRLALINYHLSSRDAKAARGVAQAATAALPDNAELLEALGRAEAAAGDNNQALATFGKLVQLQRGSLIPHLRIADVHWASGDREAAINSLKRAQTIEPDNLQVQRALVDAYLAQQAYSQAARVAKDVQRQRPNEDAGYLLLGSVEAAQKRWAEALAFYRQGLKVAPDSSSLTTRMHVALMSSDQKPAAEKLAADWLRTSPQDASFRFYLGDFALASRQFDRAESLYREVLKLQPENALALNNVAWLMATAKKPGAVDMARKAVALLPERPVVMDTLALALASEGQMPEAVDVMRRAVTLQDGNPQLRFNLAKLLVQAGDKAGAKTELNTLAALGDKFPRQAEVADLMKTL
jgi:putative PEP-CTERM system TPR-repeat lipoprotein